MTGLVNSGVELATLITVDQKQVLQLIEGMPKDILSFIVELRLRRYHFIWIDWHIHIEKEEDVFRAIETSMRWYGLTGNSWNALSDMIVDLNLLPEHGCVMYFSDLQTLFKEDKQSHDTFIEILRFAKQRLSQNGYQLHIVTSISGSDRR